MSACALPGERVENAPTLAELPDHPLARRLSAERYRSPAFAARERERLWARCWQVVGRDDELPTAGSWLEYRILDQSFLVVRGGDGRLRAFVNSCRHRDSALGEGRGRSPLLTCPYHGWSYDLTGRLRGLPHPDFPGATADFAAPQESLALLPAAADSFAGFVFLNPDPQAPPLQRHLGGVAELLAPYRLEEMVPVGLDVEESLPCNWKAVMDAFGEGYHLRAIHPELAPAVDETQERTLFLGPHSVATAPFGAAPASQGGPGGEAAAIRALVATFGGLADCLPRFEEHLAAAGGAEALVPGQARRLLQRAVRELLGSRGLDLSGLTDAQMSDNHYYLIFPNLFLTARPGECTAIAVRPHESEDPRRCRWRVWTLRWLPEGERSHRRAAVRVLAEGERGEYFLALEQDRAQLALQGTGLTNPRCQTLQLTRQEARLAHFHAALDRWLAEEEDSP